MGTCVSQRGHNILEEFSVVFVGEAAEETAPTVETREIGRQCQDVRACPELFEHAEERASRTSSSEKSASGEPWA